MWRPLRVPARARAPAPHGDGLTADSFDLGKGFGLAVVADFDHAGRGQRDGSDCCRGRERDMAIGGAHIGRDTAQTRCDHDCQNAEQQAHGEREQGEEKRQQQNSQGNPVPVRLAGEVFAWGHRC
jgi:hypothetical protein